MTHAAKAAVTKFHAAFDSTWSSEAGSTRRQISADLDRRRHGCAFRRVIGLAYAISGDLESATEHLAVAHEEWLRTRSSKLSGVGAELAAVLYLRGRYTEALDKFAHPTEGSENHIFAATLFAAGGATRSANIRGAYDDVIAFLRARLHETKTRV